MAKLELWYPLKPWHPSQGFGGNAKYYASLGIDGHNGVDVPCKTGTLVRAAHEGIVTFAGEDGAGGQVLVLRTVDKFDYQGEDVFFKTIYAHLRTGSFKVRPNQNVKIGDILAESNNTGFSTGPHLHFGLKPVKQGEQEWAWENVAQTNGYKGAIDPKPYFVNFYAEHVQTVLSLLQSLYLALKQAIFTISGDKSIASSTPMTKL